MNKSVFKALEIMQYIDQVQAKLKVSTIPLTDILYHGYKEQFESLLIYDDREPTEVLDDVVDKYHIIETLVTGLDGMHAYKWMNTHLPDVEVHLLYDTEKDAAVCVTMDSRTHGFSIDVFPTYWEIHERA